ncbi:unnamed protein product [Musa acuminata subsp. burmannicoides]
MLYRLSTSLFRWGREGEMAAGMRCFSSPKIWRLALLLHLALAVAGVEGQSTGSLGFIYIDCGIPENTSYVDAVTGITYVSDDQFVDAGINYKVWSAYVPSTLARRYETVRSFPVGARNCYTFESTTPGLKYLVRATFLYGNYDLKDKPVQFDLYLGVNLWKTINITNPTAYFFTEVVAEAAAGPMSVCLVNTGLGTPFISGLDLRPMGTFLYPMVGASRSLVLLKRLNMASSADIRFPLDRYDRYWFPFNEPEWKNMSTTSTVQNPADDHFQVPSAIMQTAVYPADSTKLEISLTTEPGDVDELYAVMYFSELQPPPLQNATTRRFFVYLNGAPLNDAQPLAPEYLRSHTLYNTDPAAGNGQYNISLVEASDSKLPPILNALEVLSAMRNTNMASDSRDVGAMMAIKELYQVKRNWAGDPCAPKAYTWDGLNCTFNSSGIPRITAVNLSYGGLTGEMITSFANLSALRILDLSHNNLTGSIPDALAFLPSLKLLDLTNNQLEGSVPSALLAKSQNGSIALRIEGNPNICIDTTSCKAKPKSSRKRKIAVLTIIISCIVPVIIPLLVVVILCIVRKQQASKRGTTEKLQNEGTLQLENRKFTYIQLQKITNNFERTLGKGGFGTVYYGRLEDGTEVAVKMLSQTSSQGTKEFLAEVQHLTRVHHKNLVSMVGYCKDGGDHLALVYEYMSQGTLKDHLRGTCSAMLLSWRQRLQIALEAALGLEYLHTGCKPPLIHRDVKSANILLNERLEAKISDFGLSKAFLSDDHTHISTKVVGTLGYLDPEYYIKNQLSQKSDVYSFGVVLLELITGQPPVLSDPESSHLVEWVRRKLAKGNIEEVVDAKLQQEYCLNSSWKVANIALECVAHSSVRRPTMTEVVLQLKESLALCDAGEENQYQNMCSDILYTESGEISKVGTLRLQETDSDGPSAR